MNWKVIISGIITLFFLTSPALGQEVKPISPEQFAHKLKQMIMENDIGAFDRLHIGQLGSDGTRGDVFSVLEKKEFRYRSYIFGAKKGGNSIRQFLLEQENVIYISPYGAPTLYDIIFYNPKKVNYPKDFSNEMNRRCWNICYVQTSIELVDGKWRIPSTAFYSERHLPWVGEYG